MIAKGSLHNSGAKLAAYLVKGKAGELAEMVEMRGFAASDLRDAFRDVEIQARDTKAQAPFLHLYTRFAPGEMTDTPENRGLCLTIMRREIEALGYGEQGYAISFHIDRKTGELHGHAGINRIARDADGKPFAIDPGLYKNRLKELSRECERDYGLTIISSERQPGDRARAAGRNEVEEGRRLGTDVRAIRTAILDCFEKSDNGKSFAAAIRAQGMELANGDRRDCFVVIDQASGHHALNKKLTGMTLEAIRDRLADLDRTQLPSVEQAKEIQRGREIDRAAEQAMQTARAAAQGRTDEIRPDRSPNIDRQAEQAMQEARAAAKGRTDDINPQPEIRPLGKTAGEIRLAWQLTKTPDQFAQALEDRGLILVHISREEAEKSHRAHAFAKAIDRQNRELKEGFAVVDARGNVTRIDQRTTGDQWEEIQKRLGGIDKSELVSIADAKEAQREANHAAWVEQQRAAQERERLPNRIESRIAECGRQARWDVTLACRDRADPVAIRPEAIAARFAARLEEAGIAIARATETDVKGLAALREQEGFDRASGLAHKPHHFAELLPGELATVTSNGDIYRINPDKLGEAKQYLAAELPGVIDTRARLESEQEQKAEIYAQHRADNLTAQKDFAAERESGHQAAETARDVREVNREVGEAVDTGFKATGGFMRGLSRMMESFLEFLGDLLFPAPPPTRDQAERMERVAEENRQERAHQEAQAERTEAQHWLVEEARRQAAREREEEERAKTAAERFGTYKPRAQEQDNERDRDRGYELER